MLASAGTASGQRLDISVGVGDQASAIFDDENFRRLGVEHVRYAIKWDAIDRPDDLEKADAFVRSARRTGADVLLQLSSNTTRRRAAPLPAVSDYAAKAEALVRRYRPLGVKTFGTMNQANHDSQPTWNNPRRAAQLFLALRSVCDGCRILALDVLDQEGVDRYIRRFYSALGERKRLADLVGVHNFSDTNYYRSSGTRLIIETVKQQNPRARFWLTETGGVVKFCDRTDCRAADGKAERFSCSRSDPGPAERRAARAIDYMFKLVRQFRRDLQRLYIYNFFGDACSGRFDAGLVRSSSDPTPRPAYEKVRRQMKDFKR